MAGKKATKKSGKRAVKAKQPALLVDSLISGTRAPTTTLREELSVDFETHEASAVDTLFAFASGRAIGAYREDGWCLFEVGAESVSRHELPEPLATTALVYFKAGSRIGALTPTEVYLWDAPAETPRRLKIANPFVRMVKGDLFEARPIPLRMRVGGRSDSDDVVPIVIAHNSALVLGYFYSRLGLDLARETARWLDVTSAGEPLRLAIENYPKSKWTLHEGDAPIVYDTAWFRGRLHAFANGYTLRAEADFSIVTTNDEQGRVTELLGRFAKKCWGNFLSDGRHIVLRRSDPLADGRRGEKFERGHQELEGRRQALYDLERKAFVEGLLLPDDMQLHDLRDGRAFSVGYLHSDAGYVRRIIVKRHAVLEA